MKHKLLILVFLVSSAVVLLGQDESSVSIRALATIVAKSEIDLITIKDLELDESLAKEGIIYIAGQSDPAAGVMLVRGNPDTQFRVTFLHEMELMNVTGPGMLLFFYEVYGYGADNQQASEPLDATDRVARFNDKGEYYLWIGGRIDISQARPGSYEGEFILEIEYM